MDFLYNILSPISWLISYIMYGFHVFFGWLGLQSTSSMSASQANAINGWNWALSIVGLTIVVRIILIPLFVKQIRASRSMQLIQPEMQKIQAKYKGKTDPISRQAQSEEMMGLYKDSGTNPFSSCLPILLQSPVFFALFRVLRSLDGMMPPIGAVTKDVAEQGSSATFFGAPLNSTFMSSTDTSTKIVAVVMILMMCATQFYTQRQLVMKNMPAAALDNPIAKQQKMLMYLFPIIFAVSGVAFPIGVLIYWTISNLWTLGQQFYVIHRMPAPGSEAEKLMLERKRAKALKKGEIVEGTVVPDDQPKGQRQQPKRTSRKRRNVTQGSGDDGDTENSQSSGNAEQLSAADGDSTEPAAAGEDQAGDRSQADPQKTAGNQGKPAASGKNQKKKPSSGGQRNQPKKKRKKR